jgi:hypothetical protein
VAGRPFNPPLTGYAGVVAGDDNVAGDFSTGILAGQGRARWRRARWDANIASGFAAAVGGGSPNTASGRQAVVPGGELNVAAGMNSLAGGTRSVASTVGSFVWSDDASGAKTAANLAAGVSLAPGSAAWSTLSDRNLKTGIEPVDQTRIRAKPAAMLVSEWSDTAQGSGVRHLGPMAQDFGAAFGLGEDDRHSSTVDEEGVALAAIQALQTEVAAKARQISDLDVKYARLAARLDALEAKAAR